MNTILLAVDGSQHADNSLQIAASLARQNDAEVIVLYVTEDKSVSKQMQQGIEIEYADQIATRMKAVDFSVPLPDESQYARTMVSHSANISRIVNSLHGEIILRKAVSELHEKGIKSIKPIQVEGDPADRIIEASVHHNVDTIVMGCRGVAKLQGIVLGSSSQSVAHRAKCSVVIVK
jgi:nucleotide-binding universal stress UspA family protein